MLRFSLVPGLALFFDGFFSHFSVPLPNFFTKNKWHFYLSSRDVVCR